MGNTLFFKTKQKKEKKRKRKKLANINCITFILKQNDNRMLRIFSFFCLIFSFENNFQMRYNKIPL